MFDIGSVALSVARLLPKLAVSDDEWTEIGLRWTAKRTAGLGLLGRPQVLDRLMYVTEGLGSIRAQGAWLERNAEETDDDLRALRQLVNEEWDLQA
jgi:hypothetical protein